MSVSVEKLFTNERELRKMANTQNTPNQGQGTNIQNVTRNRVEEVKDYIKDKALELIIGVIAGGIAWTVHDLPDRMDEVEKNVSIMQTKMESIDENYSILNSQIWSINKSASDNKEIINSEPETELKIEPTVLLASNDFSISMIQSAQTTENKENPFFSMDEFQANSVIGTNIQNNESITKEAQQNEPFIMQYKENGEDVFFYGKYNESGQWDGECIINRYKDLRLTSIMEGNYENGKLKSYKHIFKGANLQKQDVWYVSSRVVEGGESSGETVTYFCYGDYEKKFENESVKKEDILSIDGFINTIPSTIEGYYNGYISNGRYNDESGGAYLIKYKPNGDVRFLYKGKIKDGYPHDSTGNAWSVAWGYANDGYYYYKGTFTNGQHGKPSKKWKPMTQEEISKIVNPDDFEYPLTGLID